MQKFYTEPNLHDVPDVPLWEHDGSGLTSVWGSSFYVLPGAGYSDVVNFLAEMDGEGADNVEQADCVVFTGGADVHPELYGEEPHHTTHYDKERDDYERAVFNTADRLGIPMLGICRGSQFLNVMCGGSLWQNVDGHAIGGTHTFVTNDNMLVTGVTSTHHQMSRVGADAVVLGSVHPAAPLARTFEHGPGHLSSRCNGLPSFEEIEAFYYPSHNVLGIQGHPEWADDSAFARWASLQIYKLIHNTLPLE